MGPTGQDGDVEKVLVHKQLGNLRKVQKRGGREDSRRWAGR